MAKKGLKNFRNNYQFIDNAIVNDRTYFDYLERFKKIALSMFEWVNLPKSMNAMYLEKCLYYLGQATFLKDKDYGFINTRASSNGYINIYGYPTSFHCWSYDYDTNRKLYSGLPDSEDTENTDKEFEECILVQNNWERIPTANTLELFAYRLYEAEQTALLNIRAQKTPILILTDEKQRLTMENLYSQYDGNKPVIFGDKNNLDENKLKAISTEAPFVADKIMDYKKEIWNECLTFLGINNIMIDKKERLITDEASSNNELINLNLQSYLAPRQEACRQFNEKFGLTGTDKEISVRVRSDLHNIIKNMESVVTDYNNNGVDDIEEIKKEVKEGVDNG